MSSQVRRVLPSREVGAWDIAAAGEAVGLVMATIALKDATMGTAAYSVMVLATMVVAAVGPPDDPPNRVRPTLSARRRGGHPPGYRSATPLTPPKILLFADPPC
ncbi:MAG: hypothetical protein JRN06_03735 [Nitrososphaerota archaeon]|nr:hypothetical protein [Nitrososphaerota archaeon]MDG7022917.1 hypothetical protein [Nitrososphaerota archaeon]